MQQQHELTNPNLVANSCQIPTKEANKPPPLPPGTSDCNQCRKWHENDVEGVVDPHTLRNVKGECSTFSKLEESR